jgi:hypothetical protein
MFFGGQSGSAGTMDDWQGAEASPSGLDLMAAPVTNVVTIVGIAMDRPFDGIVGGEDGYSVTALVTSDAAEMGRPADIALDQGPLPNFRRMRDMGGPRAQLEQLESLGSSSVPSVPTLLAGQPENVTDGPTSPSEGNLRADAGVGSTEAGGPGADSVGTNLFFAPYAAADRGVDELPDGELAPMTHVSGCEDALPTTDIHAFRDAMDNLHPALDDAPTAALCATFQDVP